MARSSKQELERRIQERIWTRIANSEERRLRRDLARVARETGEAYKRGASIDAAVQSQDGKIRDALVPMWTVSYETIGQRVAGQLNKKSFNRWEEKAEPMSDGFYRGLQRFLQVSASQKITQIASGSRNMVTALIEAGIEDGLSVDEIGDLIIKEGVRRSVYRAHLISRTETHAAANAGSLEAAKDTGRVKLKEWIPVDDSRTRTLDNLDFDHVNVDPVPVNEPFIVSGERLMFPGDPAGSAGNVINCRCAIGYITEG